MLNAKGVKQGPISIDDDDDDKGTDIKSVNLIESLYHVQDRAEAAGKRRKIQDSGDDDDERKKKQKFEISGGSGVMSEFVKDEKAKDVAEIQDAAGVAATIDLTGKSACFRFLDQS